VETFFPDGHFPDGHFPDGHFPEADASATPSIETRRDFEAKWLRRDFHIRRNEVSDDYLFDEVVKDPDASRKVRLKLYPLAVIQWQPHEIVEAGEYCRPRIGNGFAYIVTSAGTTGAREPRWPTAIDATVTDGSVIWTCKTAAANGINAVSSPSAVSDPTGLTISNVAVSENCNIDATYSGGVEGTDYDAVFTWTLDGVPMVGRQTVRVAKQ
jgi:hypothetical protein